MTVGLIFVMIGIFLWGYVIMLRFEKFISKGEVSDNTIGRRKMGILIFGSHEAVCNADKEGIQYMELTKPVLPKNDDYYSAILILSKNEADNLALCQAVYQYDPDIYIIVRCENPQMKDVYRSLGANRIILPDESSDMVLAELWRALR